MKNLARTSSRRRAAGFTLIELLVVIGIIVTLASLILPAINAAKEETRRTQCLNHLKQISAATIGYETSHRAFPPGYLGPVKQGQEIGNDLKGFQGVGVLGFILTNLGKDTLADRMDTNLDIAYPAKDDSNTTNITWERNAGTREVAKYNMAEFVCPSAANQRPLEGSIFILHTYWVGPDETERPKIEYRYYNLPYATELGITNYLGSAGVMGLTGNKEYDKGAGIFGNRSRTTIVRDGKSYTLLFGEATNESGKYTYSWMGAGCLPTAFRRNYLYPGTDADYIVTNPNSSVLFSSYHRGGIINFAFADGSCRGISMEIDQNEFEALSGANDGYALDLSIFN